MPSLISLFDVGPLWQSLISGQLILTPNQRLASRIRSAFAIAASEAGHDVVFTPAVYSLNQWLDQCWLDLLMNADPLALDVTVLSATQEQALWEKIVADSSYGSALLRPSATAQQAIAAFRTLVDWRQDTGVSSLKTTALSAAGLRHALAGDEDSSALLEWTDQFLALCDNRGWLPSACIPERLLLAFQQGRLNPCGDILGVGFEDITPLHQAVLDVAGHFSHHQHTREPAAVKTVVCDSPEQELQAAAVWAKQTIKNDPAATVAIVVPDLTAQRQVVQRIMQEVFEPDYNFPCDSHAVIAPASGSFQSGPLQSGPLQSGSLHSGSSQPTSFQANASPLDASLSDTAQSIPRNLSFNFSAGYPISDAPIVSAALDALGLGKATIDSETAVRLCQSPFYCMADDDTERASRLIERLFGEKAFDLSTAKFRQLAASVASSFTGDTSVYNPDNATDRVPGRGPNNLADKPAAIDDTAADWVFSSALQNIATLTRDHTVRKPRTARKWVEVFDAILDTVGWPGQRRLDSIEYQQVSQWPQLLQSLAALGDVLPAMSFHDAVSHLHSIASRQVFQPQTADSSLQVLGTLEAAGLHFSHLWITSMSDQSWPPAPSPNSLLPFDLQRQQLMPHASAE